MNRKIKVHEANGTAVLDGDLFQLTISEKDLSADSELMGHAVRHVRWPV